MIKHIPISIGEFIDKITILEIKKDKINNPDKLKNISKELDVLLSLDTEQIVGTSDYYNLKSINLKLWEVEDLLRIKETQQNFNSEFIELARSVYKLNDERATLKKQINIKYNSTLIEEKSYE